jgi:N-acetylmuramoyl-L-alanine amidase
MAINLEVINKEVTKLLAIVPNDRIAAKAANAKSAMAARNESVLQTPGETKSGIQAISAGKDVRYDPFGDPVAAEDSICKIGGDVPGLEDNLVGTVDPADEADLNAIIGADDNAAAQNAAIQRGKLKKIITSGSPEAIAASLGEATGKTVAELKSVLTSVSSPDAIDAIDVLDKIKQEGLAVGTEFKEALTNLSDALAGGIKDWVGDLFGNITLKNDKTYETTFNNLVDFNDPLVKAAGVSLGNVFKDLSDNKYDDIINNLAGFTKLSINDLESRVKGLSLNPSKAVIQPKSELIGSKSIPCFIIGSNENTWRDENTPTTVITTESDAETARLAAAGTRGISTRSGKSATSIENQRKSLETKIENITRELANISELVKNRTQEYQSREKYFKKKYGDPEYLNYFNIADERDTLSDYILEQDAATTKKKIELSKAKESLSKLPTNSVIPKPSTAPTQTQFTFVSSKEELQAEFASCTRDITEVVAHWTATYTNQDIGAEEVHEWHKKRGWSGIGYHYIIRRDGRIQRGRPISKQGAHANDNGHNKYSLGISFAAGYNCPSGTKNPDKFVSADSITPQQMRSFEMFMSAFYDEWPGGQAWGHVDTDNTGKPDPGFSVQEYVKAKFDKLNVANSGQSAPLSPTQLASAKPGTQLG